MAAKACGECRRLTELYFKLAGHHSVLLERQRLLAAEDQAEMEPLIDAAQARVNNAREDFTKHRKTHFERQPE